MVLRSDGHITWDSPAITKSSCKVDVSYLPFDGQRCRLTFGSWTYNGNQIDLRNRLHTGDPMDSMPGEVSMRGGGQGSLPTPPRRHHPLPTQGSTTSPP